MPITGESALFYYFSFDNAVVDLFIIVNVEIEGAVEWYRYDTEINVMERDATLAAEKAALRIKMIERRRLIPEKSRIEIKSGGLEGFLNI